MSAQEWIAKRREIEQAATPAPWKTWATSVLADPVGDSNIETAIPVADTHYRNADGQPRTNDADFIADARVSLPRAVNALEAVLGLHRENPGYPCVDMRGFCWCGSLWPCRTVQVITAALEARP